MPRKRQGSQKHKASRKPARPGRGRRSGLLRELGCPDDLPPLPAGFDRVLGAPLPGAWGEAARYARLQGISQVLKSKRHWGVGVGRDVATGGPALVYLTRGRERPGAASRLPEHAEIEGRRFPIQEMALSPDSLRMAYRPDPRGLVRSTGSGGFTGSAISTSPFSAQGGALTGIFASLGGHSHRGVTCAHVALDLGIANLLNNLPASLGSLFRSPAGQKMYAAGDPHIGQSMFELFEVDTPWPILTPVPYVLMAGVLTFLYVDVAAGPVRPAQVPGFNPPPHPPPEIPDPRVTIFNVDIGHGSFPIPGAAVYKIGPTTGLTWGTCLISSLFIPVPIPLLPVVVLLWVNLHRLAISPGDSGCLVTGNPGQELYDIDGLGLGATATTGNRSINALSFGLPFPVASLFAGIRN